MLRAFAALLCSLAPPGGRAFRIGGDEFAMVFECATEADARAVGWSCRRRPAGGWAPRSRSASRSPSPHEGDEELVARADAALYAVKRGGRNGVLVAQAPGTTSA